MGGEMGRNSGACSFLAQRWQSSSCFLPPIPSSAVRPWPGQPSLVEAQSLWAAG